MDDLELKVALLQEAVAFLAQEAAGEGLGLPSDRPDLLAVQDEALQRFAPGSWLLD